jgi:hypothetical protein
LRGYQERAADWLYEHDQTLLNAPMGAGKTATTLVALRDMLRDAVVTRVLVLAPLAVCRYVWPAECAKWTPDISLATAVGTPKQRQTAMTGSAQVVVLNFENVVWAADAGLLDGFDCLVIDELTKLKSAGTKRWKTLRRHLSGFKVRIGMTGTVAAQRYLDLFGQVTMLDNGRRFGKSFPAWRSRHFRLPPWSDYDWQPLPGTEAAIHDALRSLVYTVEPGEYAAELPSVVVNTVRVAMPPHARALYAQLKEDMVLSRAEGAPVDVEAGSLGVLSNKLRQLAAGFLYQPLGETQYLHPAKFDRAAELLDELPQTLVLYQYKAELEAMLARCPAPYLGSGVSARASAEAIDAWNRGELPVLYGHTKSMGHGLNLQHGGHTLLWLSLPWAWEEFHQARARLIRSGQTETVFEHVLLVDGTIDEDVLASLQAGDDYSARLMRAIASPDER